MIFGYKVFGILFFLGLVCILGCRLENSMDEVICGKRIANHNVKKYDIFGIICFALEFLFDYILNSK